MNPRPRKLNRDQQSAMVASKAEAASGPLVGSAETTQKLQAALERGGIVFIAENGGGSGVRLRKRQWEKQTK
jgi:hypothetical protein